MSGSALASMKTPPISVSAELTQRSLYINQYSENGRREGDGWTGYVFLPMLAAERVWGGLALAFGKGGGASAYRREENSF